MREPWEHTRGRGRRLWLHGRCILQATRAEFAPVRARKKIKICHLMFQKPLDFEEEDMWMLYRCVC